MPAWLRRSVLALVLGLVACASSEEDKPGSSRRGEDGRPAKRAKREPRPELTEEPTDADRELAEQAPRPTEATNPGGGPDISRTVLVLSRDHRLWSFNPSVPGKSAYELIGPIECQARGLPQSMAVDRQGYAWVFYDSGQLFRVSTRDAFCMPTPYKHPSHGYMLGMAFTASSAGASTELLYILSPEFGLAKVGVETFVVEKTNGLRGAAELTGGGDGKLFHFKASDGTLSEVDRGTNGLRTVHRFKNLFNVHAFAFARYAGRFYLFTSTMGNPSKTTVWDPRTDAETVRDPSVGFVIVGAGQSTRVPPTDGGEEIVIGPEDGT